MRLLLIFLLPVAMLAQSYLISTIPLPKTYVQNLDPYPCDTECLDNLVKEGSIFYFLAYAQDRLEDERLNDTRLIYNALFNIGTARYHGTELKIALLLPHRVIGRYAFSTTNSVFAYMLTKNRSYEIRTYQIEDESYESVETALRQIQSDGFMHVIAPMTQNGAETVVAINPDLNIYFPTINKHDIAAASEWLYFGGIDYRAQIDTLLMETNSSLVIFSDSSRLGKQLETYTEEEYRKLFIDIPAEEEPPLFSFLDEPVTTVAPDMNETNLTVRPKEVFTYTIDKHTSNLEKQLKDNEKIQFANFFLNTPIIKSGMVMSQLTLYDVNVSNVLSTQISYDPLLLSITQYKDREEMVIANSIGDNNNVIIETNALLSNDIMYDWINYATTVGVDYFFHKITQSEREYDLPIEGNQVIYPVNLVKPSYSRFIPYAGKAAVMSTPEQMVE